MEDPKIKACVGHRESRKSNSRARLCTELVLAGVVLMVLAGFVPGWSYLGFVPGWSYPGFVPSWS